MLGVCSVIALRDVLDTSVLVSVSCTGHRCLAQCSCIFIQYMDATITQVLASSGGAVQRVHAAEALEPREPTSQLREQLLEAWGWGLLSAPLLQALAEAGEADGITNSGLQQLAAIGSRGLQEGNCHRDLVRQAAPDLQLPPATWVPCHLKRVKEQDVVESSWPVLLPSHMFLALAQHFPGTFEEMMAENVLFWRSLKRRDPRMHGHPVHTLDPGWEGDTMPIAVHGDAGVFTKTGLSVVILSWSSIMHRAPTWDKIFLTFAIPKVACSDEQDTNTFEELCQAVAHDFEALYHMRHPPMDAWGNPWEEGSLPERCSGQDFAIQKRGVLWMLLGDLDWFANYLKIDKHYNSNTPCLFCDADRGRTPWTEVGARARWRATILTAVEGRAREISQNALFRIPGVSRFSICLDVMHTVCLGVAAHAVGSCLYSLVQTRPPGETLDMATDRLFGEIRDLYAELGSTSRLNNLKLSMFKKPNKYACMSARAAEIRGLVPVLHRLARAYNHGAHEQWHRELAMSSLAGFYGILDVAGVQLSGDETDALQEHVVGFLLHYKWLSLDSMHKGQWTWQMVTKHHYFEHIALGAGWLNPRLGWTYQYENFVQKMIRVCGACISGTAPHRMGASVVAKYRTVLQLRLGS